MNDAELKKHEDYRQIAIYTYDKNKNKLPEGYKLIEVEQNPKNGFYACLISDKKDVIIAFRGSDVKSYNDLSNDGAMSIKHHLPSQAYTALKYYKDVKSLLPNAKITLVGHSLGGSLAQIVAAEKDTEAVTFNPYGTKNLFKEGVVLNENKITNYCNSLDPITQINARNQVGKCYVVKSEHLISDPHKAENMKALATRVLVTPKNSKNNYSIAKEVKECVGSYMVRGYVRSDGTKVSEYERRCGAAHENSSKLKPRKSIAEMSEAELNEILREFL